MTCGLAEQCARWSASGPPGTSGRNGTFTVTCTVAASGTSGYVSIKAQAGDAAGSDITQEIDNAYAASSASSGRFSIPAATARRYGR